jgi:hypothetical protein
MSPGAAEGISTFASTTPERSQPSGFTTITGTLPTGTCVFTCAWMVSSDFDVISFAAQCTWL